jgi:hypothetical protein
MPQTHCTYSVLNSYTNPDENEFWSVQSRWTVPLLTGLAYLLNSRSCVLLDKPPIVQPAFYGTRTFIIVFTRALHWSLS